MIDLYSKKKNKRKRRIKKKLEIEYDNAKYVQRCYNNTNNFIMIWLGSVKILDYYYY
jgi:hypothetical protein